MKEKISRSMRWESWHPRWDMYSRIHLIRSLAREIQSMVRSPTDLENFGVPVPEIRDRVDKIMELTNITYLKDKNPFELSGGQQQRVAFASVLVLEPDVFVIDEPTSQLDPKETERVFDIIQKMKEMGKTIILVEHKMELVAQYCDEVLILEEGQLIRTGEKHEVLSEIGLMEKGVMLPQTVLLADKMRQRGLKIRDKIITEDEMLEELVKIGG